MCRDVVEKDDVFFHGPWPLSNLWFLAVDVVVAVISLLHVSMQQPSLEREKVREIERERNEIWSGHGMYR